LISPAGANPAPRVLVIGLDAADRELIEQWEQQGLLPTISRMKSIGTWASLHTTAEIVHVSAWPSIFTGTTPDKHGLYHAYVMQPGQQAPARPRPDLCPAPFLWKTLDEHGKRCIVIDAFLTCPLQNFGGIQIVDWGTWTWFWEQTILPATLGKQIAERFGPYPAEDHSKVGMTPPPDPAGFRDRLLAGVARKTAVTKWLMQSQEWDFFLVVFGESHPAGHYFWQFHDPDYVSHSPSGAPEMRHALRDVYIALDRAIGELLQIAGENTLVCLVSGDGMGPNYSASHLLAPLLERMRLMNEPAAASTSSQQDKPGQARRDLLATLRGLIPKSVRATISRRLLPRSINEKLSMRWKTAGIAWERTRAFPIENANEGYIRVNLKGREPQGVVQPGQDYQAVCDSLVETANTMINPANGRRAIHEVHKTDDLYRGPCRAHMPDVIINWNPDARITTQLSTQQWGTLQTENAGYAVTPYYTGNHRPNAFTALVGPGITPGRIVGGASILDLAPTILARFGIVTPAHMDGRVLDELTIETLPPRS
jgi:predicted AlkP superfamily phosphohydrolase/phosphomutase